jgi:uncharacterized protein YbjQ (UPF0145 family)
VLIVTIESVPGYATRSVIGMVDVQVMRTLGWGLSEMRQECWRKLGDYAASIGANAIVGFRFESFLGTTATHVLGVAAYGTAVVIEAVDDVPLPPS